MRLSVDRAFRRPVGWLLLVYFLLASGYSLTTPIFEGFDEHWHYAVVDHLARGKGLPRQPPSEYPHLAFQEASQPPLYYALAAAFTWWVPTSPLEQFWQENPQFSARPVPYKDNQSRMIHSERERFPYRDVPLAVRLARFLSILMGVATLYSIYLLCLSLYPGRATLAHVAMSVAAFTPSFLFSSGLVSNDNLAILLATLSLLVLVRAWRRGWPLQSSLILGLLAGGAALTKLSGLLLLPVTGLVLALHAWRTGEWRRLFLHGPLIVGVALVVAGWWYLRNWSLYGDPTGLNMMLDLVGRRPPGFGVWDALAELEGVRRSYWAIFGWFNILLPGRWYQLFDLISLLALVGVALHLARSLRYRAWTDLAATLFLLLWLTLSTIGLVRWTMMTLGSQGRLLYPAIGATSILLAQGWLALLPSGRLSARILLASVGGPLLAISLYAWIAVLRPTYAPPAAIDPAAFRGSTPLAQIGEAVRLRSVRADSAALRPGTLLWVEACWEAWQAMEEDYFVFVQLLADHDLIMAQKDSYHGLGTFPTSHWPPTTAFCERYPLQLPELVPPTSTTTLAIGLYSANGERLPVQSPDGESLGDHLRVAGPGMLHVQPALPYHWHGYLSIEDIHLESTALAPGAPLHLSIQWRALRSIPTEFVATVQIMDEQGNRIGQSDLPLHVEERLTSAWEIGTKAMQHHTITLSPDAAPGVYYVHVALYNPDTGKRPPLYRHRELVPTNGLLRLLPIRLYPATSTLNH